MLLVITSFISEKILWKHGTLEVLMHGKSILWDVAKYAVYMYIHVHIYIYIERERERERERGRE